MELRINADDGRAERLAPWVREMNLADQAFVTGATLVFEDIRLRRDHLPIPYNEADLREGTPEEAYGRAVDLSNAYANQPPYLGDDGVDEHWRISNMAREVADRIAKYHPDVVGGGR